jgi:hypothetical protein
VGRTDLTFDFAATVLSIVFDRHTLPNVAVTKDCVGDAIEIRDFGRYRHTIFGIPVGPVFLEQISLWAYPKDGPMRGIGTATVSLSDEDIRLDGLVNLNTGTVSGTVVPEPSTLALAGIGVLGLFVYSWKRRERKGIGDAARRGGKSV